MTMMRNCYSSLLLFLLFCVAQAGQAQEISDYSKLAPEDYTRLTLPSLDLLFENAKGAPTYELAQVEEQVQRKLLAKEKRAFLGFFSIRGSYQYGMFGNESTFTDVATVPYLTYSTAAQNGYTLGAAVSIPLDGLLDLGSRIKRQKLNVRSAELQKEIQVEDTKKVIIELYTSAAAKLQILKLRAEAVILANIQYDIIEKNFANGTVSSGELSAQKDQQSLALERYENSKAELNKSLMILEIITQTPIIKK